MFKDATISGCGKYRYKLTRIWNVNKPILAYIMLNPSVADAAIDDRTICKCMKFAADNGYGGIAVYNLFAWRSTDPSQLPLDPIRAIGMENDDYLKQAMLDHSDFVLAWGTGGWLFDRANIVINQLTVASKTVKLNVYTLGLNNDGSPKHPLYLANTTKLIPYKLVC